MGVAGQYKNPSGRALRVVAEDLGYLKSSWGGSIEDATLRRDSAILRRFVCEGLLGRAWNEAGFRERYIIPAPRLEYLLESPEAANLVFAIAGGCDYGGLHIALSSIAQGKAPDPPNPDLLSYPFQMREFGRSASLYVEHVPVQRSHIIQYVANKLGGVHVDDKRGGKAERQFRAIERNLDKLRIGGTPDLRGKNVVYFELLAIGQLIVTAPDTERLLHRIQELPMLSPPE